MCLRRTSTFSPSRASWGAAILRPSFCSSATTSGEVTAWRARPRILPSIYQYSRPPSPFGLITNGRNCWSEGSRKLHVWSVSMTWVSASITAMAVRPPLRVGDRGPGGGGNGLDVERVRHAAHPFLAPVVLGHFGVDLDRVALRILDVQTLGDLVVGRADDLDPLLLAPVVHPPDRLHAVRDEGDVDQPDLLLLRQVGVRRRLEHRDAVVVVVEAEEDPPRKLLADLHPQEAVIELLRLLEIPHLEDHVPDSLDRHVTPPSITLGSLQCA